MDVNIDGLIITPLKQIFHSLGDIYHGLKASEISFCGFGEAYFSTIISGEIKAWKRHREMTLNFIVPVGFIKVVVFDDRSESTTKGLFFEIILSPDNYKRLTIPPNLWVGFAGVGSEINLLLNIGNIEHDPTETDRLELSEIKYNWS